MMEARDAIGEHDDADRRLLARIPSSAATRVLTE
jgi:hypothetical protein